MTRSMHEAQHFNEIVCLPLRIHQPLQTIISENHFAPIPKSRKLHSFLIFFAKRQSEEHSTIAEIARPRTTRKIMFNKKKTETQLSRFIKSLILL